MPFAVPLHAEVVVLEALNVLKKLSPPKRETNLDKFKQAFENRYESEMVPLLEVLDDDMGLSYPHKHGAADVSPLVDDLPFTQSFDSKITWDQRDFFLFRKYLKVIEGGHYVLDITATELEEFNLQADQTIGDPDTLAAMLSIVGEDVDGEEVLELKSCSPHAAKLLGRFGHLDQGIHRLCQDISLKEQELKHGAITAELAHLPQARVGNVLLRPALTDYEIPYLANSRVDADHQILLSDLFLFMDKGRLVLWSKKLNKEVRPSLSNAHNFAGDNQPVYRFLCEFMNQDIWSGLMFRWGDVYEVSNFLPRVTYKNIILSAATWKFKKDEMNSLFDLIGKEKLGEELQRWRTQHHIPQWIAVVEGDNELLINLENDLFVNTFLNEVKNKNKIVFKEFLHAQNDSRDYFTNEVILPFHKHYSTPPSADLLTPNHNSTTISTRRTFITGDQWLYLKIYCGTKTANKILTGLIAPLAEELQENGSISHWFFIRYTDPNHHLRVRFCVSNDGVIEKIRTSIAEVFSRLVNQDIIDKIQFDTYDRELERYGWDMIENSERLFCTDSEMVARTVPQLRGRDDDRWLFCVKAIDSFLDDFGLSVQGKFEVLDSLTDSFNREFDFSGVLKKQVQEKYRENRQTIGKLLSGEMESLSSWTDLLAAISERSVKNDTIVTDIKEGVTWFEVKKLLQSYIHMNVNRLIPSRQRQHELVLYNMLWNHYRSAIAREKALAKTKEKVELAS